MTVVAIPAGQMFNFGINVSGNSEAKLAALAFAVQPIATQGWLGLSMKKYLEQRVQARFASEGDDAVGGSWLPLSDATNQIRQSKGYPPEHPINVRTGELKRYVMTSDVTMQGTVAATLQMPGSGQADPELRKKLFTAQHGWVDPGGSVTPARPVLGLSAKDMVFAISSLSMYVQSVVAAAR